MPKRKKHLVSLASARKVRAALASQANTPAAGRASPGTSTSASSSLPKGYKTWKKRSTSTGEYRIDPVKKFRKALDKNRVVLLRTRTPTRVPTITTARAMVSLSSILFISRSLGEKATSSLSRSATVYHTLHAQLSRRLQS